MKFQTSRSFQISLLLVSWLIYVDRFPRNSLQAPYDKNVVFDIYFRLHEVVKGYRNLYKYIDAGYGFP